MSRFYISDGARPGQRIPVTEHRTHDGKRQSDCLNEAQAIARGRKLAATLGGGPVLPAILADMAVYDAGLGGTMGGFALSSFPNALTRMIAGDYAGAWTVALKGSSTAMYGGDLNITGGDLELHLHDEPGAEDVWVYVGANQVEWLNSGPSEPAGDFFFFATDGTSRENGAPLAAQGTLPSVPAGAYSATGADALMLAWPRVLTPAQMDEAMALYA